MKKLPFPDWTHRYSTASCPMLCAVAAALLLTGCPTSKLPDVPPSVPHPKATLHLFHHSFEL